MKSGTRACGTKTHPRDPYLPSVEDVLSGNPGPHSSLQLPTQLLPEAKARWMSGPGAHLTPAGAPDRSGHTHTEGAGPAGQGARTPGSAGSEQKRAKRPACRKQDPGHSLMPQPRFPLRPPRLCFSNQDDFFPPIYSTNPSLADPVRDALCRAVGVQRAHHLVRLQTVNIHTCIVPNSALLSGKQESRRQRTGGPAGLEEGVCSGEP